jgi:hypothetical protein
MKLIELKQDLAYLCMKDDAFKPVLQKFLETLAEAEKTELLGVKVNAQKDS